jgi:hypothetical protein
MAGVARESLRVIGCHHLRKCLRLRAVRFMAAAAYYGRIEFGWFDRRRIVSVLRLWAMASLAWNNYVSAQFLLICDIRVATFADLMPRVGDGPRRDLTNRGRPVVSVLAETLRHHRRTQGYKSHYSED